jgi:uncharacterized protein YjbJ (UPF0337 family)
MKDQIKGKAEEVHGKMTGDKSEELKGKARQVEDKVKRTVRDAGDDVRNEAERNRERNAETVTVKRSR